MKFFISVIGFREGIWVMFGSFILRDGYFVIEEYGVDFD